MSSTKRNRAYHNFFEGYTEYKEDLPNGKSRIRRVYTGLYYRQEQTRGQKVGFRLLYSLLFVLAAAAFIFAATVNTGGNLVWYTAIPVAVAIFFFLWFLMSFFYYLPLRDRTVFEFRAGTMNLLKACRGLLACAGAAVLLHLIYLVLNRPAVTAPEYLSIAGFVVMAAACSAIYLIEDQLPYSTYPSPEEAPNGVLIT